MRVNRGSDQSMKLGELELGLVYIKPQFEFILCLLPVRVGGREV